MPEEGNLERNIMDITNKEKSVIRAYYAGQYYKTRFLPDGTLEAKQSSDSAWGILYTPYYTEQHVKHMRGIK